MGSHIPIPEFSFSRLSLLWGFDAIKAALQNSMTKAVQSLKAAAVQTDDVPVLRATIIPDFQPHTEGKSQTP